MKTIDLSDKITVRVDAIFAVELRPRRVDTDEVRVYLSGLNAPCLIGGTDESTRKLYARIKLAMRGEMVQVEDWMRINNVEPYKDDYGWYWDGPNSDIVKGREQLPAGVWVHVRESPESVSENYLTREDAIAALRLALLSLNLIAE